MMVSVHWKLNNGRDSKALPSAGVGSDVCLEEAADVDCDEHAQHRHHLVDRPESLRHPGLHLRRRRRRQRLTVDKKFAKLLPNEKNEFSGFEVFCFESYFRSVSKNVFLKKSCGGDFSKLEIKPDQKFASRSFFQIPMIFQNILVRCDLEEKLKTIF